MKIATVAPFLLSLIASTQANESDGFLQDVVRAVEQEETAEQRIVGGTQVPNDSYPWFVEWDRTISVCGGTLISSEYILTAAHCVAGNQGKLTSRGNMYIGSLCRYSGNCNQDQEKIRVENVYLPSNWNAAKLQYDAALIRLKQPSTMTPANIDVNGASENYTSSTLLTAIGYGWLDWDSKVLPNHLQHVDVPFVPDNVCWNKFKNSGLKYHQDSMICAAGDGTDACAGDSGGPLLDKQNNIVTGIVSWGVECAHPNYPGVYTRVSSVAPWLKQIVCAPNSHQNMNDLPSWCPNAPAPTAVEPVPVPAPPVPAPPVPAPVPVTLPPSTSAPTSSPVDPTPTPPKLGCTNYRFALKNDQTKSVSRMVLKSEKNRRMLKLVVKNIGQYKSNDVCIPNHKCWRVIFVDKKGNGLCDPDPGAGFLRVLKLNDEREVEETVFNSSFCGKRKKIIWVGDCQK